MANVKYFHVTVLSHKQTCDRYFLSNAGMHDEDLAYLAKALSTSSHNLLECTLHQAAHRCILCATQLRRPAKGCTECAQSSPGGLTVFYRLSFVPCNAYADLWSAEILGNALPNTNALLQCYAARWLLVGTMLCILCCQRWFKRPINVRKCACISTYHVMLCICLHILMRLKLLAIQNAAECTALFCSAGSCVLLWRDLTPKQGCFNVCVKSQIVALQNLDTTQCPDHFCCIQCSWQGTFDMSYHQS